MQKSKIYLSGAMTDVPEEESRRWRENAIDELSFTCFYFFNPWEYFDFNMTDLSNKEVMNYDLWQLRSSQLVLANLEYQRSIGTIAELTIAYEKKIPIIAYASKPEEVHPWLKEMCEKIFNDWDSLYDYIDKYYACNI